MWDEMLLRLETTIDNAPELFAAAAAGVDFAPQTVEYLSTEPGRPQYPIRWASERQRRAFFATDGFGRGIPTRRTGALTNAWQAVYNPEDTAVELRNPVAYMKFVQGRFIQPFHIDTGWRTWQSQTDRFFLEAIETVGGLWVDTITSELEL